MEVVLQPLPRNEAARVHHLALGPGQGAFVHSAADMAADDRPGIDLHRIATGDETIGFFAIDRSGGPEATELIGMLIGAQFQGRGHGRAALAALPRYLRTAYPGLRTIRLVVDEANTIAARAYLAAGWTALDTPVAPGRSGPQRMMALSLGDG